MAQKAQRRKRKGKSKGIMSRLFGKSPTKTAKKGKVGSVRSPRSRVGPSALDKLEYKSPLSSPKSARKSMRGKGKRKTRRHRRRKSRRSMRSKRSSRR